MEIKGSKTEKNLMEAFAGESQARNKYTYFASQAKKDGYVSVSNVFTETANNEMEHAKLWFKHLNGGSIPSTIENLVEAAAGEHGEWTSMYKRMAEEAKEEGFEKIASQFEGVAEIEKRHEERYLKLLNEIKETKMFSRDENVSWICLNCGHVHENKSAPKICMVCDHLQSYFEELK